MTTTVGKHRCLRPASDPSLTVPELFTSRVINVRSSAASSPGCAARRMGTRVTSQGRLCCSFARVVTMVRRKHCEGQFKGSVARPGNFRKISELYESPEHCALAFSLTLHHHATRPSGVLWALARGDIHANNISVHKLSTRSCDWRLTVRASSAILDRLLSSIAAFYCDGISS